jgi:putative acetyltransferase
MGTTIRESKENDHEAILHLVKEAFSGSGRDGQSEVEIVEKTWSLVAQLPGLELVAADDQLVVGHILGARADLDGRAVVGVAPLSVSPSRQRSGIGSALMAELLHRAEAGDWSLAVVLGDPEYYGRFGFEAAGPNGIFYRPAGISNPHFQVRPLSRFAPSLRGEVSYCWELPSI